MGEMEQACGPQALASSGAEVMFAMIRAHGNAGNLAGELHRLGDAMGLWERQTNMGAVHKLGITVGVN